MKKLIYLLGLLLAGLFLTACGGQAQTTAQAPTPTAALVETGGTAAADQAEPLTRVDEQGQVVVEVTPQNFDNPGETLDFQVVMNTHSADLSMDLATLATLTTGTGQSVQAVAWDGPREGHHVEGTLSFPATVDGAPILDGAQQVTLTLVNVDVPERVFTWER